jgi:hypothetical protein
VLVLAVLVAECYLWGMHQLDAASVALCQGLLAELDALCRQRARCQSEISASLARLAAGRTPDELKAREQEADLAFEAAEQVEVEISALGVKIQTAEREATRLAATAETRALVPAGRPVRRSKVTAICAEVCS